MDNRGGPSRDFESFFTEEFPVVVRAAWFVVLDADVANDVAQEAFCRALQRWHRIAHYEQPQAWVRTVAVRIALRSRDRRRREVELTDASVGSIDELALPNGDLSSALRSLPRQQRAAAVLRYLYDFDIGEVAAALDCKPTTARVHLHRARQALADLLGVKAR